MFVLEVVLSRKQMIPSLSLPLPPSPLPPPSSPLPPSSPQYEEEEDEETGEVKPKKQRKLRRAKKKKSTIYDVYEPSELERGHFTEKDSEIRVTDMPERFQLRAIPVQQTEEGELDEEAEWIHQQAFCKTPVSKQVGGPQ